jgi:hypothetical protein
VIVIANLHTLQITTEPAKPFPAVPWQRLLRVKILQLHALGSSCHSRPCRTIVNCRLNYSVLRSSTELVASNCPPHNISARTT